MDVLGAAAAGRRVDAAAVDSSFTFHKLSTRGRGAGIQKPRIRPRRSALPVTSLMPDWHPLKVTRLVWQDMEKRSNAVNQPSASLKLEVLIPALRLGQVYVTHTATRLAGPFLAETIYFS